MGKKAGKASKVEEGEASVSGDRVEAWRALVEALRNRPRRSPLRNGCPLNYVGNIDCSSHGSRLTLGARPGTFGLFPYEHHQGFRCFTGAKILARPKGPRAH